jgi:hypothetical protein
MPEDIEKKKQEQAAVQPEAPAQAPPSLLAPVVPQTPWERMQEKHGTGESILRILGTGLSGGILGDVLMPEMTADGQAQYDAEMKAYGTQADAYLASQALAGIDPENLTPGHIALGTEYGGTAFGEYLTDRYAAQQNSEGGDAAIAEHFDYTPYQWSKLSPEKRRDLSDRYNFEMNGEGAFDYRQYADGSAPEQLAEAESAKSFGTAEGTQYGSDRDVIRNVRTEVLRQDQGIEALTGIKAMIEDPENEDLTGWPRIIRDFTNTNRREDGTLSAEAASRVIELISQATFGALNEQELQLLKDGVLNPSKSGEFNIGTLDKAIERISNERERTLQGARSASERYRGWEGQDDYDTLFEDDWLYNNVGDGSKIQAIPAFGGNDEYTFQQYTEDTMSELGPFDQKPSRDELVNGFAQMRKEAEEMYKEQKRLEKENSVAAQQVRATLERPFPTVEQYQ